jgi:hypothetical protein
VCQDRASPAACLLNALTRTMLSRTKCGQASSQLLEYAPHGVPRDRLRAIGPCDRCLLAHGKAVRRAAPLPVQVVFFHPSAPLLSAAVLGVLPLLRPFTAQCVVLPVMPAPESYVLELPVPFMTGCQYKTPDVAARCVRLPRARAGAPLGRARGALPACLP